MPFDSFKHSIESEDTFKVHTLVQPLSMVYEYTGRLNFLFFEIDLEIYWASEDNFLSYTIDVMYWIVGGNYPKLQAFHISRQILSTDFTILQSLIPLGPF